MALMEWEFSEGGNSDGQFMATGKVFDTLRRHLAKGEVDQAVALYESCVQETVGAQLWNEFAGASTTMKKAIANLFYRARDYGRAAAACEDLGEWSAAAKAYAASDRHEKAAECHLKLGEKEKAAKLFERGGQARKAAEIYYEMGKLPESAAALEAAGDVMGAGQLFHKAGDHRRATQLLAQVQPKDPRFVQAVGLLGEALVKLGRRDLALQRLAAALPRGKPVADPLTAELAYRLGRLALEEGHVDQARAALEMVRIYNPAYRDLTTLLEAAKKGTMPPPSNTGSMPAVRAVAVAPSQSGPIRPASGPEAVTIPNMSPVKRPAAQATDPFAALDGNPFARSAPTIPASSGPSSSPSVPTIPAEVPLGYVQRMEGYEVLKHLPIFEDLSMEEMKAFYLLSEAVTFQPGEILIEQGHPGEALYIIKEGNLRVSKVEAGGKQTLLATIPAGKYVGEMSLVDEVPTSARVTAEGVVKALKIRRDRFEHFLYGHDRVALRVYRNFVRTLSERLRQQNARA